MLTGLEKHLHSAIWASSRIILKLKTFIEIPTQIFSQWFETRFISAICPKVMSFLAFDMLFHISSWNSFQENISNEVVKEIFISVLSSDMAFISSFTFCATTLSHHTSQTPLFMCLQSQSHFERNLFNVFRESCLGYSDIINLVIRLKMKESIWSSQLFYFRFNLLENIKSPPPDLHDSPSRD